MVPTGSWVLPHLWVVELVVGEHHVDGSLNSDGRGFGRCWISSGRAMEVELKLGIEYWVHQRATDEVWEAGMASPEWIELEPEAERGGRRWRRRPPRGSPGVLAGLW